MARFTLLAAGIIAAASVANAAPKHGSDDSTRPSTSVSKSLLPTLPITTISISTVTVTEYVCTATAASSNYSSSAHKTTSAKSASATCEDNGTDSCVTASYTTSAAAGATCEPGDDSC